MQMIVAGLMALTAMGASILAEVDPVTVVVRGGIAFACGLLASGVWSSLVNPKRSEPKSKSAKVVVESVPEPAQEAEEMEEAA